ncbi:MAG: SH3 domain-containing protein [Thermodesulfobacteriota bacterium]
MSSLDQDPSQNEADNQYAALQEEANSLLAYKKANIKRQDKTPCPACATLVHVNANKCPHCTSDISEHTEQARQSLSRLQEINKELNELHSAHMERRAHESGPLALWANIKSFFSEPQTKEDMKILVPSLFLFFVAIIALRVMGTPLLFWLVSIAGGVVAYSVLNRVGVKRFVTVELYRSLLIVGLLVVMGSAFTPSLQSLTSIGTSKTVTVARPTANIRAANSTSSAVVATARQGDKLKIVAKKGAWYRVKTSDGTKGWIYASLVRE